MSVREASTVFAAAVVALTAILGGAFYPGPRVAVGMLMAVTLGLAATSIGRRLGAEEWSVFGFIVWGIVAAVVAASAPLAAREVVAVWIVTWALWLIARRTGEWGSQFGLIVLAAAAGILALGVVLEAIGVGRMRVGGLLENPNVTASLLVVTMPTLLVIDGQRFWRFAAGALITLGLVLTGSRAGLLAALAAGAVILPRGRPRFLGLLTGSLGIAAVLIWRFVNQPDILAWFRPAIWVAVVRLWATHPLVGVGPGGLVDAAGVERLLHADHVGQRQFVIAYAESSPLAVLVQTGLVGLLIAVGAFVFWWWGVRHRGGLSRPMGAGLAAMAVIGAFHDLLTVDVVLWWWALTIGFFEARAAPLAAAAQSKRKVMGTRVIMGLVFSFVVLWGVVQPAWARWLWRSKGPEAVLVSRTTRAEPWYDAPLEWRSRYLLRKDLWTWDTAAEAIAVSGKAVRIHPGAARLWSVNGMIHARVVTDFGPWRDSVDGARKAFGRAVELEPHQPWVWLEWARLERNLGLTDNAVGLVRKALDEEPHTVRARLFLARLELDRGDTAAARDAYDTALQSVRLRTRLDLNAYERELLSAPAWQIRELGEALR
jgi:hypothetical protein